MHDSTDSANNVVSMSEDFRTLDVPYSEQVLGCVGDAWVRTVHFSAPRYCDGTDVSGYAFTVHFENERGDNDFYTVDDLTVGTNELTFTWLVSPIATAYEGTTGVSVVATDVDAGTGEVEHRISSETFAWRVLPATYSDGYEFIEQETVVEAQIAIWQAQIDAALSVYDEIIPVSAFSSASTVKDAIDDVADVIPANAFSDESTVKDAIDNCYTKAEINNFAKASILPNIVGIDVIAGEDFTDKPQFGCVCSHNGVFYGFYPLNNSTGKTILRMYDRANNTIVDKGNALNGHANSCCFDEINGKIICTWLSTNGIGTNNSVNVYDDSMVFENTFTAPRPYYGVSFDSNNSKLYAMGVPNSDTVNIYELSTVNYSENSDPIAVDLTLYGNNTLQDFAINDGLAYISFVNGIIAVFDISTGVSEYIRTENTLMIDSQCVYRLGESSGLEFDEYGALIQAFSFTADPFGCIGFCCQLNNVGIIPKVHYIANYRTVTLSESYKTQWNKAPYENMSLLQLLTYVSDIVSMVNVTADFEEIAFYQTPISKNICINIASGKNLTIAPFVLSCDDFTIFNEGTITFAHAAGKTYACILTDAYHKTKLTINNRGTITNDDATVPVVNLGYNKGILTVGNIGNGFTVDSTTRQAIANTLYLGGAYKITSTSA